jgi:LPXTG-site transpeptidase (sortase) family protein
MGPAQTTVKVLEPELKIEKTANVTFIAEGSTATFTLTISHTPASHADAFDVVVSDVLPVGLNYVANSIDCSTGEQDPDVGSCNYDPLTRTIKATWSTFTLLPANDKGIIKFDVVGTSSMPANGSVTNVTNVEWSSLPGDQTTPHSFSTPPNPNATERHYDPTNPLDVYRASSSLTLTPVGGGGGGGGGGGKKKNSSSGGGFLIPVTGFAPNTVTELNPASRVAYDSTDLTIKIPAIKVNTTIVGVQLKDGNWDVSWLQNKAGWLNGTAYPTWTGNSVLTAHSVYSNGQPGIFSNLKDLNAGEYIFVYSLGNRYTYKVISNKLVQPNDITVLQHEDKPYLTLITCNDYNEKTGTYLQRVAVRAVLIDVRAEK